MVSMSSGDQITGRSPRLTSHPRGRRFDAASAQVLSRAAVAEHGHVLPGHPRQRAFDRRRRPCERRGGVDVTPARRRSAQNNRVAAGRAERWPAQHRGGCRRVGARGTTRHVPAVCGEEPQGDWLLMSWPARSRRQTGSGRDRQLHCLATGRASSRLRSSVSVGGATSEPMNWISRDRAVAARRRPDRDAVVPADSQAGYMHHPGSRQNLSAARRSVPGTRRRACANIPSPMIMAFGCVFERPAQPFVDRLRERRPASSCASSNRPVHAHNRHNQRQGSRFAPQVYTSSNAPSAAGQAQFQAGRAGGACRAAVASTDAWKKKSSVGPACRAHGLRPHLDRVPDRHASKLAWPAGTWWGGHRW